MFVQKVRSEGVSHLSYFIGGDSDAAVVDPRRDIGEYLEMAKKHEMSIRYVLETHRNEDIVSGARELATVTGARVLHGGQVPFRYGAELTDGQVFELEGLTIKALHTPGHTPESFSFVLYDHAAPDHPLMVFCGDTILPGDVGRTDLRGKEMRIRMASDLYESIARKLMPLGPGTILCPAHGAGSVCGGNIADREETTIGTETALNKMLRMSKKDLIAWKTVEDLELSPAFERMESVNIEGARAISSLRCPEAMPPKELKRGIVKGGLVVDVRGPHHFSAAHVPGSINLSIDNVPASAPYVIPYDRPLIIVTECTDQIDHVRNLFMRIGYENLTGYMKGGIEQWIGGGNETSKLEQISAKALHSKIASGEDIMIIDVRDGKELAGGTIVGAKAVHLGRIQARLAELPKNKVIVTCCTSGARSSCAASILLRNGFTKVMSLGGGLAAWRSLGYEMVK